MFFLTVVAIIVAIAVFIVRSDSATRAARVRRRPASPAVAPTPAASNEAESAPVDPAINTPLARCAVHEAGHLLAALRCTAVTEIRRVKIFEYTGDRSGNVHFEMLRGSADEEWCMLVIALAGIAAELHALRSSPITQSSDVADAHKCIVAIGHAGSPRPPWNLVYADGVIHDAVTDHFARFAPPLGAAELKVLFEAYRFTRALLQHHSAEHARLTATLLAHGRLTEGYIEAHFPDRAVMKLARAGGNRGFVLRARPTASR
ncbi:MAG: hypothetical protein ACHREM_00070 [Polyangiales bacterium]